MKALNPWELIVGLKPLTPEAISVMTAIEQQVTDDNFKELVVNPLLEAMRAVSLNADVESTDDDQYRVLHEDGLNGDDLRFYVTVSREQFPSIEILLESWDEDDEELSDWVSGDWKSIDKPLADAIASMSGDI